MNWRKYRAENRVVLELMTSEPLYVERLAEFKCPYCGGEVQVYYEPGRVKAVLAPDMVMCCFRMPYRAFERLCNKCLTELCANV